MPTIHSVPYPPGVVGYTSDGWRIERQTIEDSSCRLATWLRARTNGSMGRQPPPITDSDVQGYFQSALDNSKALGAAPNTLTDRWQRSLGTVLSYYDSYLSAEGRSEVQRLSQLYGLPPAPVGQQRENVLLEMALEGVYGPRRVPAPDGSVWVTPDTYYP